VSQNRAALTSMQRAECKHAAAAGTRWTATDEAGMGLCLCSLSCNRDRRPSDRTLGNGVRP
jgi:hypothetical protein